MTIQRSLALLIAGLIVALAVGIQVTVQLVLLPDVRIIEREYRTADLNRALQRIDHELARLDQTTRDWAHWDDTYDFVLTRSQAYLDENFTPHWLDALDADFLIVFDRAGAVVGSVTSAATAPLAGSGFVDVHAPSVHESLAPGDSTRGLVATPVGVVLLACSPVRNSSGQGQARGTLAIGRLLDEELVTRMGAESRLPIEIEVVERAATGANVAFVSANHTLSSAPIPLLNAPDRVVEVTLRQPRPYYSEMRRSVRTLFGVLLTLGVVAAAIAFVFARRRVIDPLIALANQSAEFARTNAASSISTIDRHDEIGRLAWAFRTMAEQIEKGRVALVDERDRFQEESLTDPLTGLVNRRYLDQELGRVARWVPGRPVLMAVLDLDFFKRINDQHGHDAGDRVLQKLGRLLRDCSRDGDIWARSGGEEFALFCRVTDGVAAMGVIERVRAAVAGTAFGDGEGAISVTVSIGFVVVDPQRLDAPTSGWPILLSAADLAMYRVKQSGRNGWLGLCVAPGDGPAVLPQTQTELDDALAIGALTALTPADLGPQTAAAARRR